MTENNNNFRITLFTGIRHMSNKHKMSIVFWLLKNDVSYCKKAELEISQMSSIFKKYNSTMTQTINFAIFQRNSSSKTILNKPL